MLGVFGNVLVSLESAGGVWGHVHCSDVRGMRRAGMFEDVF